MTHPGRGKRAPDEGRVVVRHTVMDAARLFQTVYRVPSEIRGCSFGGEDAEDL